jgi:hypothetical protein
LPICSVNTNNHCGERESFNTDLAHKMNSSHQLIIARLLHSSFNATAPNEITENLMRSGSAPVIFKNVSEKKVYLLNSTVTLLAAAP